MTECSGVVDEKYDSKGQIEFLYLSQGLWMEGITGLNRGQSWMEITQAAFGVVPESPATMPIRNRVALSIDIGTRDEHYEIYSFLKRSPSRWVSGNGVRWIHE